MGSTKAALYDLSERSNLPEEAFTGHFDLVDFNDLWLRTAEDWEQETAMKVWFGDRFYNPGDVKGLLNFIQHYGLKGPVSPKVVIRKRFETLVPDAIISSVIEELIAEAGDHWAEKIHRNEDHYDEDFSISVIERDTPRENAVRRLAEIIGLMSVGEEPSQMNLLRNLAFGAAIGALESFLWETMVFWVENDDEVVRNIITTHPAFKDTTVKLSDIFTKRETLRIDILGHMQGVVWHNADKVAMLYKYGLGITDLNLDDFKPAIMKRHDIVHRSGQSNDGQPISLGKEEIVFLCSQITAFSERISKQLAEKPVTAPEF